MDVLIIKPNLIAEFALLIFVFCIETSNFRFSDDFDVPKIDNFDFLISEVSNILRKISMKITRMTRAKIIYDSIGTMLAIKDISPRLNVIDVIQNYWCSLSNKTFFSKDTVILI